VDEWLAWGGQAGRLEGGQVGNAQLQLRPKDVRGTLQPMVRLRLLSLRGTAQHDPAVLDLMHSRPPLLEVVL